MRALSREAVLDAFERVVKCAEGAAHMTDTTLEIERLGGIYPTLQNKVLAEVMQKAREEIPLPEYTAEELAFAEEINSRSPLYEKGVTPAIDAAIKPLGSFNGFASTDYGDVMHICPGVQNTDCTAGHPCGRPQLDGHRLLRLVHRHERDAAGGQGHGGWRLADGRAPRAAESGQRGVRGSHGRQKIRLPDHRRGCEAFREISVPITKREMRCASLFLFALFVAVQ